jgi:hypothetical protein
MEQIRLPIAELAGEDTKRSEIQEGMTMPEGLRELKERALSSSARTRSPSKSSSARGSDLLYRIRPDSKSLHAGHLVPLFAMAIFQRRAIPIALIGVELLVSATHRERPR